MSEDPDVLMERGEEGLRVARSKGASKAEAYVWSGRSWETRAGSALRAIQEADESGVAVRVEVDGRIAGARTSGTDPETVAWAAERAVALARLLPRSGSSWVLAAPASITRRPTEVHAELASPSPDRLIALADAIMERLESVPRLDYRCATVATHEGCFAVANTEGVRAWDRAGYESVVSELRGEGADESQTMRFARLQRGPVAPDGRLLDDAEESARRAQAGGAKAKLARPATRVVLDAASAAQVLLAVVPSLAGNAANESRSRFSARIGDLVASPLVSLVDDPTDGLGVRNYRCDDEGTPTVGPLPLIEKGVLRNHTHTFASALKAGTAPTGHGLRAATSRHSASPKSRAGNVTLAPGTLSMDELVEACGSGVIVRGGLLGAFTVNALTGDLSCTATCAELIEGGRVAGRLEPVTVAGNVFDVLGEVHALGRDVTRVSRGACPSALVGGLTVSV